MKRVYLPKIVTTIMVALSFTANLSALEVNIKKDLPFVEVEFEGKIMKIQRVQDTQKKLNNSYAKTSRPCPPFCVQALEPIEGIVAISELDVLDFIQKKLSNNRGALVDARMPKWHQNGTIPGAVNIPFSILSADEDNPYVDQIFKLFGATKSKKGWNFSDAMQLLLFDNGPWCQQAVSGMRNLIKHGYPKDKISYYRGGMQFWQLLGLSTIVPKQ
jgi:rhodanese-related sulfurtransferase